MGVEIRVRRGSGSNPGPDIVDPLILTVQVARDRGRAAIDDATSGAQKVQVLVKYRPAVLPGQLVEVQDSFQGQNWRAKVIGVRHVADGQVLNTLLTVVRP